MNIDNFEEIRSSTLNSWLGLPKKPIVHKIPKGKIRCYLTGKLYKDTKEERVLQAILHELIDSKGYRPTDIERNFIFRMGKRTAKPDIIIFLEGRPHTPKYTYIVIEVEPEERKPTDPEHGINQLEKYFFNLPNCKYAMWTNGLVKLCYERYVVDGEYRYREIFDIPPRGLNRSVYEKPSFDRLKPATRELRIIFRHCHNYIYTNQGLPKDQAFMELLKVIFCKIYDERYSKEIRFYATSEERETKEGQLAVYNLSLIHI